MTSSGPTDFVRKNQQHIQQLMLQRQHEHSLAEAAVLAESRQRQKLRDKVLSMREEKWSSSLPNHNGEKPRTLDHSETMPYAYSSTSKVTSPLRRCLSAASNAKQDQTSTAPVVSTNASREQENMVGKPYAQSVSRTQNMSPQRVPTERFQDRGQWTEDYARWRRRNSIAPDAKVFVITGVYPDVRASLLARGWVENPDPDSSFFDLKWCLRTRSIYNPPLLRHQIVNHYSGAGACLTTKYGLLESIQHIRWYFDVNVGTFFPRAMKLGTPAEFQALETEFKWCAAASILRRLLLDNGLSHEGVPSAEHVQLAMKVCRQQTAFRKDLIDDDAADGALPCLPVMPEDKWGMLLACPCFKNCQLTPIGPSRPNSRPSSGGTKPISEALKLEATQALAELAEWHGQSDIDGGSNIWILKPGGKSRGRGISCTNSWADIKEKADADAAAPEGTSQMWVAQKYIEQPLIINRRKFDMRQWVLVTNSAPMTAWFYQDCYLRFCAEDYSLSDLTNVFSHLSNNCIARKSLHFESGDWAEGNMWSCSAFSDHLDASCAQKGLWQNHIQPQMQRIVQYSLACATESLQARPNSHELFGYDFVVDQALNVWLIEVNCSPSLEHSTPVTARLCAQMMDDLFKVVVDLPERRRNRSPQRQAPPPPRPPHPAQSALPAESLVTSEASTAISIEGSKRPYSSRPEGCVGWVEADMPAGPVATFAAAAQDSAATALKAVPGPEGEGPENEGAEGEGRQEGSSSNVEGAGAEAGRLGSSQLTREGKRGQGRSHSRVVGQVEGPLQLSSTAQAWRDGLGDVDVGKWDLIYRGEPVGDCGGCQVMSNPLILHGTQISIPKPRPQPMPRIAEDSSDSASQQAGPLSTAHGVANMSQGVSAANEAQAPAAPFRTASTTFVVTPSTSQPTKSLAKGAHMTRDSHAPKERVLNADERLQRLKLRTQSTIQAYSGNLGSAGSAGRYTRTQSMTAASPHAVFHPTRPSMVSLYGASRRATEEASRRATEHGSSNHSSSSCSSATSPASGQSSVKGGVSRGGAASDDCTLLQANSMSSKRGIPPVQVSDGPSEDSPSCPSSQAAASASAMVSSLMSLKASPALVAAFLRTQPDIKPAVVQKPQPVAKLLPVSTKCLNDAVIISPRCQNVGGFSDATSPRCAYASRVRRSLTLNPQSPGSNKLLPDIPLGRYRQ
ncbi:hypothetical protein WJX77_004961 [Trebouxia sp. C0004]